MKFVSVRELKRRSADLWRRLPKDRDLVITSNGKPVALMTAVDAETLERDLSVLRRARVMAAVASMQLGGAARPRLTESAIEKEISEARRGRKSR